MRLSTTLLFACLGLPAWGTEDLCSVAGPVDRIDRVSDHGDLSLASGDTVRLIGIRLPETPWLGEALTVMRGQVGREILVAGAASADRWGRRPVRLVVPPGASPIEPVADLARKLVASGLALVDMAEDDRVCGESLLAVEASARAQRLGLWAGDRYTPIPVAELARLKDRIGRFTLIEGRVRSVGERPQRTYLNFSSDWANDFTMIVPKRIWSRMAERGLTGAALKGRLIRARGILEDRQGPALTAMGPAAIEVIEEGRRPQAR